MSETLQAPARRGITERDVWLATDAVVAQGRRPTIDAVRQQLGRGSPNTIQAHLDSWFAHLGERLEEVRQASASPLPPFLTAAASHLWDAALSAAREVAAGEFEVQRKLLAQDQADLDARQQAQRQEQALQVAQVQAAQANANHAAEGRAAAERREALANERAGRLEELVAQLSTELDQLAADLRAVHQQLEVERVAAGEARAQADDRLEGQERHWLAEVERARAEATKSGKARDEIDRAYRTAQAAWDSKADALAAESAKLLEQLVAVRLQAARSAGEAEVLTKALGKAVPGRGIRLRSPARTRKGRSG